MTMKREGREELFKFSEERRTIVGGIREDPIQFFRAHGPDTQEFRCFGHGIAAGRQGFSNDACDAHETIEVVGEMLPRIDVEMNRRHHDFGFSVLRQHDGD